MNRWHTFSSAQRFFFPQRQNLTWSWPIYPWAGTGSLWFLFRCLLWPPCFATPSPSVVVVRVRPRAILLAMITMTKSIDWFPLICYWVWGSTISFHVYISIFHPSHLLDNSHKPRQESIYKYGIILVKLKFAIRSFQGNGTAIVGNGPQDYTLLEKLLGTLIVDMIPAAAEVKDAVRGSDDVWPWSDLNNEVAAKKDKVCW